MLLAFAGVLAKLRRRSHGGAGCLVSVSMIVMEIRSSLGSRSASELLGRCRSEPAGAAASLKWRLLAAVAPLAILALASLCAALEWADVAMASPGAATSAALSQVVSVPADSTKLRPMQILAAKAVSQISGQAISGAVDDAIADGFSENPQLMTPNATDTSGLADVATAPLVALDAWSARAVSGLAMSFARGPRLTFGGEFGGLGTDYTFWTAKARAAFAL